MNNKLFAYFDIDPTKEYPIISQSVYTDNFNEEIDSMSIVLDGVSASNEIVFNEPYHFVKIVNKGVDLTIAQMQNNQIKTSSLKSTWDSLPIADSTTIYRILSSSLNFVATEADIKFILLITYENQDYVLNCKTTGTFYGANAEFVVSSYHKAEYNGFLWGIKRESDDVNYPDKYDYRRNWIFMLVDSWTKTQTNAQSNTYRYEINLMNTIKIFEKIQCPNRVITHSLQEGVERKTIFEYIDQYMFLYSPKIKISTDGQNWSYDYLFDWSNLNVEPFNNTICADMQFNEPTLRELLTHLMIQVDCIPTIEYRTVKFINFRETPTDFVKTNSTFITESGSSDSYNNSITVSPSQILDSSNVVISENVGFRDRRNAIISQTANLQIETRFPIYKVEKLILRNMAGYQLFWPVNEYFDSGTPSNTPYPRLISVYSGTVGEFLNTYFLQSPNRIRIAFRYVRKNNTDHMCYDTGILKNIKVHFCTYDSGTYTELNKSPITTGDTSWNLLLGGTEARRVTTVFSDGGQAQQLNLDGTIASSSQRLGGQEWCYFIDLNIPNSIADLIFYAQTGPTADNKLYVWFENDFIDTYSGNQKTYHQFVPVRPIVRDNSANNVVVMPEPNKENVSAYYDDVQSVSTPHAPFQLDKGTQAIDLTPLVYEERKRRLLNTNYAAMQDPSVDTLEEFSQYIYATLGYNIGDNRITGFSSTYSSAQMWWNITTSYLDNIIRFYLEHGLVETIIDDQNAASVQYVSKKYGNMPITNYSIWSSSNFELGDNKKGKYFFSITYQPLNNFKIKLPKENKNIPLDLTALNQTESGLTDFDRFVKNNQSLVNRAGNKVFQLPQTTDSFDKIMPLNSLYQGKYVVFQRKISISFNYIQVLYTMAEKFVLQNYFTSIITKYRAYEYVDYEQSTVRKENLLIYCMLSDKVWYDGDDHIKWQNSNTPLILLSGIDYGIDSINSETKNIISYIVRKSKNLEGNDEATKEELSIISYNNGFAMIFEEFDNVSAGLYLNNFDFPTYASLTGSVSALGGAQQSWQKWDLSVYNVAHEINFVSDILITNYGTTSEYALTDIMIKFPILTDEVDYERFIVFSIVHNNKNNLYNKKYFYYKDNAEVLNQTVQFHFYSNEQDILFSEFFFENSESIYRFDKSKYQLYVLERDEFKISDEDVNVTGSETVSQPDADDNYSVSIENGIPIISINWDKIDAETMVVIMADRGPWSNVTKYKELISFKKNGRTGIAKYRLTLNDTKTNDVWYFYDDNELFLTKKCKNSINTTREIKEDN